MKITKRDFLAYFRVQQGGRYNMLDVRARQMTGLSEAKYYAIIDNYTELREKHGPKKRASK